MEQMEEGGCIFYDNRKKRNLAADHKLCDALRLQVAYLFRRHHVIDFLVLDSSDSDIVFSSIVDEYRKSIRRSTKISCTIYFKNFCGNLHNYHTNFNCMARYDDILKAVDCVVRQSTRLLLLDDGTLQKPYIYELADSMKIPIYIVDPTRQTFRVKHQAGYSDSLKQAFLNVRALRAIVPHNLKKRLAAYAEQYPDECCKTDTDPETGCMEFDVAKGRFSFRLTAPYSEERRRAASEAAKAAASNLTRSMV